jgi:hypothetical protein
MKQLSAILVAMFIGAGAAFGAIGDTPSEVEDNYKLSGKPPDDGVVASTSTHEGIDLRLRFVGGYCVEERYSSDREIPQAFMAKILKENASTSIWNVSIDSGPWLKAFRSDGQLRAEAKVVSVKAPADSPDLVKSTYYFVIWKS